jgi:uncharacterized membrane protein YdjX (TVP38/TMEM64 family)
MGTDHSQDLSAELHGHLKEKIHWKTVALRLAIGLCFLAAIVWIGSHVTEEIKAMQTWIRGHGVWGRVVFVCMAILLTSMFVPDTVFAVASGLLFGLVWGSVLMIGAAIATAALNFISARTLLRPRIETMLQNHPKLQAIRRAADREGLRLQLLLRLSPLNPVSVSYVLGASGVRWTTFMIATLGLVPGLFVEVYFGYMASHVSKVAGHASEHSQMHTIVTLVGFALCVVLMVFIARIATRALAEAEGDSTPETA